uniref:Protein kinase domain-containing protein n=1 Tax=Setaria digitata TaxID=48799 RepID=A0A915Q6Q9_9BILA
MVEFDGDHSMSSSVSRTFEDHNRLPQIDDIVKSSNRTYHLIAILGEGGYGKVFHAIQNGKQRSREELNTSASYTTTLVSPRLIFPSESNLGRTELRQEDRGTKRCVIIFSLTDSSYPQGAVKPDFVFMVVTLLGKDLYKLRNEQPDRHFSISSAIRVGIHTCKAIEELHSCGFLSRDIKPGNYAVGLEIYKQHKRFFLFDFGLARKYLDKHEHPKQLQEMTTVRNTHIISYKYERLHGQIWPQHELLYLACVPLTRASTLPSKSFSKLLTKLCQHIGPQEELPPLLVSSLLYLLLCRFQFQFRFIGMNGKHQKSRGEIGWRGTTRYGSLKAHLKQDLGRRDDLESWFYCLVEITCGMLPWRHVADRDIAYRGKVKARNEGRKEFLANCPKQYDFIMALIDRLDFPDLPNYSDIYKLLDQVREEHNVMMDAQYDWEDEDPTTPQQFGSAEIAD